MKKQPTISQRINSTTNLKGLCDTLNEIVAELNEDDGQPTLGMFADLASLPTFGGSVPAETSEVWSWDETSVLVAGEMDGNLRSRWIIQGRK